MPTPNPLVEPDPATAAASVPHAGTTGRVVYVLAADGPEVYSAMTRVSVASVRVSNPQVRVDVVCDQHTDAVTRRAADPLRDEVDTWIVQETPDGNPGYRSRHVKTRLRECLHGPFLYLDGDTFVRAELAEVFGLDTDVAGARNHSADSIADQIWVEDAAMCHRMGWPVGERDYLNGGVVFYADTPGARAFGAAWHRLWLSSVAVTGAYRDQPALNAALGVTRPRLEVLPHRFNAQFRGNLRVSRGAVIQHYYAVVPGVPTAPQLLAERLLEGVPLRRREIEAMIRRDHPWRRTWWVDDWFAARLARKATLEPPDMLWLSGRRVAGALVRILNASGFGRRLLERASKLLGKRRT